MLSPLTSNAKSAGREYTKTSTQRYETHRKHHGRENVHEHTHVMGPEWKKPHYH